MRRFHTILLCLIAGTGAFGLSFNDAVFDRLDINQIDRRRSELRQLPAPGKAQIAELLLYDLFAFEARDFSGKIHDGAAILDSILDRCEKAAQSNFTEAGEKPIQGLTAQVCAIANAEASIRSHSWSATSRAKRAYEAYNLSLLSSEGQADRLYTEGRVFYLLPPVAGQNPGRSLLAFQMLFRMSPELQAPNFWLARIHDYQGNVSAADDFFEKVRANNPKDARLSLYHGENGYWRRREAVEGVSYGLAPTLFYSPSFGAGLLVGWHDDRLGDLERSLSLTGLLTSRGNVGGGAEYQDGELFRDPIVKAGASYEMRTDDYFGLGSATPLSARQSYDYHEAQVELSAVRRFWSHFSFELGMRLKSFSPTGGGVGSSTHAMGPFVSFSYDTRNSAFDTDSGTLVVVSGDFPTTVLGSEVEFEGWELRAEQTFRLASKHRLRLRAVTGAVSTGVPLPWYPSLSRGLRLPATRSGRFRDRAVLGGFFEYQMNVTRALAVVGYAGVGSQASEWGKLFQSSFPWAGGGGIRWKTGTLSSTSVRLDLTRFGDEWLMQANIAKIF